MPVNRRWIERMIETAKSETAPMPWARRREPAEATGPTGLIRTTLRPKPC